MEVSHSFDTVRTPSAPHTLSRTDSLRGKPPCSMSRSNTVRSRRRPHLHSHTYCRHTPCSSHTFNSHSCATMEKLAAEDELSHLRFVRDAEDDGTLSRQDDLSTLSTKDDISNTTSTWRRRRDVEKCTSCGTLGFPEPPCSGTVGREGWAYPVTTRCVSYSIVLD